MKVLKGMLMNLQFFTAIPINIEIPMDKEHLKKAVQTFPLLGLLQGVLYSSLLFAVLEFSPFSPLAASFILWLATILVTGGIHLDGWMDTSDALFSYQDKEKRLEIMKDPRTGAFGVLSIIILLSSRFFFIYEIISKHQFFTYALITTIPFFSKCVMGVILLTVKSAKNQGLGTLFQQAAPKSALIIYPVYIIIYLYLISFLSNGLLFIGGLLITAACCYWFSCKKADKWFGGITGDVVGASVEGTEFVLWLIVWLLHYFVMV